MNGAMHLVTGDAEGRAEAIAAASDKELIAAWQLSGGEGGDPVAEAIAAEMERREIDF